MKDKNVDRYEGKDPWTLLAEKGEYWWIRLRSGWTVAERSNLHDWWIPGSEIEVEDPDVFELGPRVPRPRRCK